MKRLNLSARQAQLMSALDREEWRSPPAGTGLKTALQLTELGYIENQGPLTAQQYRLTSCGQIIQLNMTAWPSTAAKGTRPHLTVRGGEEQGAAVVVNGPHRSPIMDISAPFLAVQDPDYQQACQEVLDLPVQDLIDRAVQAGWHSADVIAALQEVAKSKAIACSQELDPQEEETPEDGDPTTPAFSSFPVE